MKQFTLTKFYPMTGIWFDTCLRLIDTLETMLKIFGNRKISITRELTKIYEDVISSDLQNIKSLIYERQLNNKPLKGEIVIIIDGYDQKNNVHIDTLRISIKKKLQKFSLRDTVNKTIDETNFQRKLIYSEAVKIKNLMKEK